MKNTIYKSLRERGVKVGTIALVTSTTPETISRIKDLPKNDMCAFMAKVYLAVMDHDEGIELDMRYWIERVGLTDQEVRERLLETYYKIKTYSTGDSADEKNV